MPNYNYGGGNFSGFSTGPWARAMMSIPPQFNRLQQGMYNSDPNLAFDQFLRTIATSNTNEDVMRRMLPSVRHGWVQQQIDDARRGLGVLRPFSDYLSTYNWDRELARMSPNLRGDASSLFQRPGVRTVTF